MSEFQTDEIYGADGSYWNVTTGDQGVTLAPGATKLVDAPVKTRWIKSAQGEHYQGSKVQRRDPVAAFNIEGDDPLEWHDRDSRFRMAFDYDRQSRWVRTTADGSRTLKVRLLSEPTQSSIENKDPHIWGQSMLTVPLAAELAYWTMPDIVRRWRLMTGTAGSGYVPVWNPCDVPIWLKWVCTYPGTYTLPDFSFLGDIAASRVVPLQPLVATDGNLTVDTSQSEEQLISTEETPVWPRQAGKGFLFPVPKHTGSEDNPIMLPVSVTGGAAGVSGVQVRMPRNFSRPSGVKR